AIEEQGLEDSEQTITVKSMAIQQEETGTMEEAYGSFINQEHVRKDTTAPQMPENREVAVDDGGHDE
ncbi:signal peptide protein, partial [[Clostridium] innocuum]|nr:signal peptide protein [[Clostridium] innocuum]